MKKIQLLMLLMLPCCLLFAQNGEIKSYKKISATSGLFNGLGSTYILFGSESLACIGDLDKDGNVDFAVGAYNSITLEGAIFIIFMNKDKTVKNYTTIERNKGGLNGSFANMQDFAQSISIIGDIDKDGNPELIIGNSSGGSNNKGEAFIAYLNQDGTIKTFSIIGENDILLTNNQRFGFSTSILGDFDLDGINEISITSLNNNDGGAFSGIVYIVYLKYDGKVKKIKKISSTSGGFIGSVQAQFGVAVCDIGDLNKDGTNDIVVSSSIPRSLWVLFLDTAASVKFFIQIGSNNNGGYTDTVSLSELFGYSIANLGDIDGDGNCDIAVASRRDSVNKIQTGRVRLLFLNSNGTVKNIKRIDNNSPNFINVISDNDLFGSSVAGIGDIDGDRKNDIVIGSAYTNDGGANKGAIYLLSLDGAVHPTPPKALWRVNATSGNQNTVFNFTQYSTGFPSAYKWSITPNTFTYQSGTSDTSANPIIKFNQTANYSVQLKVTNPFSSDSLLRSSYISVQKVGVNNLTNNKAAISIFPNPTNGLVQIQSPINIQTILVFDITGKQLLQQEPNAQTDEINMSNLPQGLYQIHVQAAMGVLVKKLVKE
ncbi:MAG: T9SS type A sorting domain-containing protein [Bacteroidia bacterium]